jgi:tRNA A37 threonylcarbamoyladenosine modification protein TsaB
LAGLSWAGVFRSVALSGSCLAASFFFACDETLHARPDRKSPEDQEQRIVETIDNATHTVQLALQELNRLRRTKGRA